MDDFVCGKLSQWGLSEWTETFKDEGIDTENLYCLEDDDIDKLINKVGPRARFKKRLKLLKWDMPVKPHHGGVPETPHLDPFDVEVQWLYSERLLTLPLRQYSDNLWRKLFPLPVSTITFFQSLPTACERRSKILDLEVDKRELVGVFGKTGAGKSSLINAVIGQKNLLPSGSAKELSARFLKYTRSDTKQGGDKDVTRWYWPLVKCVTLRVPKNDLLQHVTLVDLPGNGDRNKSRDQMWKGIVGNCSTVWIVTEINRAASEQESWEILKGAASLLGNGGECQRIHFICTKSDLTEDLDDHSAKAIRAAIIKRNTVVKREVRKEFNKFGNLKKHFSDDCLKVFTVSSREFFKRKLLNQEDTEIPNLQEFLSNLNDCHSETLNYVSGARGILSLIQGASRGEEVRWRKSGAAFHRVLKSVVNNGGVHKPKKGKMLNLNTKLASFLTDSIDEKFRKTFPNDDKCGPFNDTINKFSLDTERLIHKYKNVELQLIFLKTEEEKLKSILNKVIRERKKTVYTSLTDNIEGNMQQCYDRAAEFRGTGSLQNMRETIMRHVHESKNIMFDQAKDEMLKQLNSLMEDILQTLWKTMKESIELSLKTEEHSIPGGEPTGRRAYITVSG
ncbi:nuclear GTPase SLIP-GC-like [Xenentodon cancila]